jgi:hypothetical protein
MGSSAGKGGAKRSVYRRGTFAPAEYLIQGASGALLLIFGIAGFAGEVVGYGDFGQTVYRFFTGYYKAVQVIFALLSLGCGTVLIATLFAKVSRRLERGALLAAAILLLVIIVLQFIAAPRFGGGFNWFEWIYMLILHAVLLVSLYAVWRKS